MTAEATPEAARTFAPVLDVSALGSFLLVFVIFFFLQTRISAIGQAADLRVEALAELRDVKARQLSGDATEEDVVRAIEKYRLAYEKVEDLRTVIPGVARIPPPPADTLSRERMDENEVAAQQFLGIESQNPQKENSNEEEQGLSPAFLAVLGAVAISQIILLGFLSLDPMSADQTLGILPVDLS